MARRRNAPAAVEKAEPVEADGEAPDLDIESAQDALPEPDPEPEDEPADPEPKAQEKPSQPAARRGFTRCRVLQPVMHHGKHVEAGTEDEFADDLVLNRSDLFEPL